MLVATDGSKIENEATGRRPWWLEAEALLLVALVLVAYFSRAGVLPIRGEEPTRAQMAFEMVRGHDWIVPREQGEPFLIRPPLQNWVIAISCLGFGNWGTFAVRFHALASTLLTTLLIYGYCRTFLSRTAALSAGVAFATLPEWFQMGRQAETEALFTLLVSSSLLLWHWGIVRRWPQWLTYATGYAFMALAMLTKGIQAPMYFIGSVIVYLALTRQWRRIFSVAHLLGVLVALAILLAWQIPYGRAVGWSNILKVWMGDPAVTYNAGAGSEWHITEIMMHWVKYPLTILVGTLPWSVLLILYLDRNLRRWIRPSGAWPQVLWSIVCLAVAFPSCWLPPGGLPRYFAPLYPSLCVLLGVAVQYVTSSKASREARVAWRWFAAGLGCVVAGGAVAVVSISIIGRHVAIVGTIAEPLIASIIYALACAGLAMVIFRTGGSERDAHVRRVVLATAAFLVIAFIGVVTDVRLARSEDAALAMRELKGRLPPGQKLASLNGHTASLFAYHYGWPIIEPHSSPTRADGAPGGLDYFCFTTNGTARPKLPFAWEEIGAVSLDRNHHDVPDRSVVVGHIIRSQKGAASGG